LAQCSFFFFGSFDGFLVFCIQLLVSEFVFLCHAHISCGNASALGIAWIIIFFSGKGCC